MDLQAKPARTISGKVVSSNMDKTIVVKVERKFRHPVYGKFIRRSSKVYAHDEKNECQTGDLVTVKNSKPLSKTKFWTLESINRKAVG